MTEIPSIIDTLLEISDPGSAMKSCSFSGEVSN
jgi:hypothetical protein